MALMQDRESEITEQNKRTGYVKALSSHSSSISKTGENGNCSLGYALAQPFAFTKKTLSLGGSVTNTKPDTS